MGYYTEDGRFSLSHQFHLYPSIYIYLFNRSADAFIQRDLEMRIIETEVIKARETILVQPKQISLE